MQRSWSFVENPFFNSTQRSYRKMKTLGEYTLNALQPQIAIPFFAGLIATLQPLVTAYNTAYNAWLVSKGSQKSKTQTVQELIDQLSSQLIRQWDIAIQNVYAQNTPTYTALLPDRRKPFQLGSRQQRKAAVLALSTAIGADAALADVKTQVDDFYTELNTADNAQQGSLATTGGKSDDVEAARIALATGMYGILGLLINNFKTTPEQLENYFDLETLRSKEQDLFTGDVNASETKLVCIRTLQPTDSIRLENAGDSIQRFAILAEENDNLDGIYVEVPANEQVIVTANQLGTIPANRYLKVKNMSDVVVGEWEVEMV